MSDVMLDLETMGVDNDAAIIAIGAVEFNVCDNSLGREFYTVIDLESSISQGGSVSASTILWWLGQTDEARSEFTRRNGIHITCALAMFSDWLEHDARIWGNGAAFDNVILRSAYIRSNIKAPWDFRNDRCFRTIRAAHQDIDIPFKGEKHNALDDAKHQVKYLLAALGNS